LLTALYVLDVDHEENFRAFEAEPDVVFAVSHFVAEVLNKRFGRTVHVLHPLINLDSYRTHRVRDFVTMINPVEVKGAEIALQLASRMPEVRFLFVEGWRPVPDFVERVHQLPNAVYMDKQIDMRTVYSRTNVLIVPSQWQEAFGRVVIEAQVSGIPVIASRTGGLSEALGRGGILVDDHRNPEAWITALRDLLSDESAYLRCSQGALENIRRFNLSNELDRMIDLLVCKE
jgi:glycosyltransferase involved in cell wall biosynthesis